MDEPKNEARHCRDNGVCEDLALLLADCERGERLIQLGIGSIKMAGQLVVARCFRMKYESNFREPFNNR